MKKTLIAMSLATIVCAPAFAEEAPEHSVTFNVGVVTDYIFRGISQSQHQPAIQGGVDYAHSSGLYVGAWGSQIEWVDRKDFQVQKDNRVELDFYGGYKTTLGDVGLDVGMIRYYYPGSFNPAAGVTANTTEAYIGGTWNIVSLKYNHVLSDSIFNWGGTAGGTKSQGSGYYDLTVTYPVDETLNVIAHIGRQNIKNDSNRAFYPTSASYTDWKLGVTKDVGFGVVGVSYTDTNAKGGVGESYRWANKDASKGVVALSFTKSF